MPLRQAIFLTWFIMGTVDKSIELALNMNIANHALSAAYAIAQATTQETSPIIYVPVRVDSLLGLILPALIFLVLWIAAWWRILTRLGYQGQNRILWLIGTLIFPINAIFLIVFAFLPWPRFKAERKQQV